MVDNMNPTKALLAGISLLTAILFISCKGSSYSPSTTESTNSSAATPSESGATEKVKPAPGTGNVQGKVLYNNKPVENIEVKLCETFNRFFGGCSGKTYTARTDKNGEYVITNVEPITYEGLVARVFETDSYVFATTGIGGLSSTKYDVFANKTLFVSPTSLFKGDLKVLNPKAGARVSSQNLELKWEPYPDAAYYKFSIYSDDAAVTTPYVNERVDGTSFRAEKPLQNGGYRWQVVAYNNSDQKLSESASDIKFTIIEGGVP